MRLGTSARKALEVAYTLGHTSYESDQYERPTHDIAKASTRGRIVRDKETGAIVIPPFALCAATETRRGRSGTTNTICSGIEAGTLISAAERMRPKLHILWLRTAYHPMDNSKAKVFFSDWLFNQWKERQEKAPRAKKVFIVGCLISCAIDNISYRLRTGESLIKPPEKCREMAKAYPTFWNECPKKMNWDRDIKPELELLFDICNELDKNALVPVVKALRRLNGVDEKKMVYAS